MIGHSWHICMVRALPLLLVGFVENGVKCEVLAKWAPHLAPKPTLFKHSLMPEVKGEQKHLHSTGP